MRRTNILLVGGLLALLPTPAPWWAAALGGVFFLCGVISLLVDLRSSNSSLPSSTELTTPMANPTLVTSHQPNNTGIHNEP